MPYKAFLWKNQDSKNKISFRDQKRNKNRSVIPYKAFPKEIKIPGLKNKIPGTKGDQKRVQHRSVIPYKAFLREN